MLDKTLGKAEYASHFRSLLEQAEIIDNRYPVEGSYILLPYGLQLKRVLFNRFRQAFVTSLDASEVELPLRIPQSFLKAHLPPNAPVEESKDFLEQVQLKPMAHEDSHNEPLFRGALDLGLYQLAIHRVRSYKDLPATYITQGYTLRSDEGLPLVRDPEVEFLEGVGLVLPENKESMLKELVDLFSDVFKSIGIPVKLLWKPSFAERFPENSTIKFFTVVPGSTGIISVGIIHYFHNHPTTQFGVQVQQQDQSLVNPVVFNFAVTQRVLFAFLAHHMDEVGFTLPPSLSPSFITVVPRAKLPEQAQVKAFFDKILPDSLKPYEFIQAGRKIKETLVRTEIQGRPLRLEAGLRDINEGVVQVFARHLNHKTSCEVLQLEHFISNLTEQVQQALDDTYDRWQNIIDEWEKYFPARALMLCESCQEVVNEESRVLGRLYHTSAREDTDVCSRCDQRVASCVFVGEIW